MLKIVLYIFAVIAILIIGSLMAFNLAGNNAAEYVGEFKPDISQIEDGMYEGEYNTLVHEIGAKISFEIKDGRLVHYEFDKLYGTIGYYAPESVILQIDQRDDLDFEAVSGATVTSNLAKAAIKNALENGPVK